MKLISRYRSEKPWYYAIFSPTETHTFQTRFYEKFYLYQMIIKIFKLIFAFLNRHGL